MEPAAQKPAWKGWDAGLSGLGALLLALTWLNGLYLNAVSLVLLLYVPLALGWRGVWAYRKRLATGFVRRPFSREHRWYLVQALVVWFFLGIWYLVLRLSLIPLQLGQQHAAVWLVFAPVLVVSGLLQLLPGPRVLLARNVLVAGAALFFGYQVIRATSDGTRAEAVELDSPFRGEALVFHGGGSALVNHHFPIPSQRNALDMMALRDGKLVDGDGKDLAAYGCFGQTLYAPAAGKVLRAVGDRPDMPAGKVDRDRILGNHVVLEIAPSRYILFAHMKQGSVLVRPGQSVACGQPLGQCGNSGHSTEPHLHMQVQDQAEFGPSTLRTYPILFRNVVRVRGGDSARGGLLSVRRNDRLRSTEASCRPETGAL